MRIVLVFVLSSLASIAMADVAAGSGAPACDAELTLAADDMTRSEDRSLTKSTKSKLPANRAPVNSRIQRRASSRWHSQLPGMFR